jgi:hypothetical protein
LRSSCAFCGLDWEGTKKELFDFWKMHIEDKAHKLNWEIYITKIANEDAPAFRKLLEND